MVVLFENNIGQTTRAAFWLPARYVACTSIYIDSQSAAAPKMVEKEECQRHYYRRRGRVRHCCWESGVEMMVTTDTSWRRGGWGAGQLVNFCLHTEIVYFIFKIYPTILCIKIYI